VKNSKQLISQDDKSNTATYKYVFSVELPKICKDDLVLIPNKLKSQLGLKSQLLLCRKVCAQIHFYDPIDGKSIDMLSSAYFQNENEMTIIPSTGNLSQFIILNVDLPSVPKQKDSKDNSKDLSKENAKSTSSLNTSILSASSSSMYKVKDLPSNEIE